MAMISRGPAAGLGRSRPVGGVSPALVVPDPKLTLGNDRFGAGRGFRERPASSTEDQIGDLLFPLPLNPFQSMLDGLASQNPSPN
jgi:hypothetical protein